MWKGSLSWSCRYCCLLSTVHICIFSPGASLHPHIFLSSSGAQCHPSILHAPSENQGRVVISRHQMGVGVKVNGDIGKAASPPFLFGTGVGVFWASSWTLYVPQASPRLLHKWATLWIASGYSYLSKTICRNHPEWPLAFWWFLKNEWYLWCCTDLHATGMLGYCEWPWQQQKTSENLTAEVG